MHSFYVAFLDEDPGKRKNCDFCTSWYRRVMIERFEGKHRKKSWKRILHRSVRLKNS